MHSDLEKLIELEKVDREITRLRDEVAALPHRVEAIESQLASVRSQVEQEKARIKELEANRRKLETEIQGYQQKISKFREQSLEVKTNDQYRALITEIEYAEQHIRASEDRILEGMLEFDEQQSALQAAEAEMKKETAEVEQEKKLAHDRTAEDEKALAELATRREALARQMDSSLLDHYSRVMQSRGSALAEARDHACSACHVLLRPQKYNEIRSEQELHTCDSCGRILFYDPSHEPPPPEPRRKRSSNRVHADSPEAAGAAIDSASS